MLIEDLAREAIMATTTIRLSEELKQRIALAAERSGQSIHDFILEAIVEKVAAEEQRADFDSEAEARFAKIVESGKTVTWSSMRSCLLEELAGSKSQLN